MLDHWELDTVNVGSNNPYTVTMNADHSLTAVFTEIPEGDTTPPTGSIIIDGDTATTDSVDIILTLSATDPESGVDQMRFSNDGSSWSSWEGYSTSKSWTLTSGDGTKTVYVQFKNGDGLDSFSYSDTITLESPDIAPPIITLSSPEETTYQTSNVFLDFTINEEVTWIGYSLDGQDNLTIIADILLSDLTEGSHTIVVFASDLADNTGASSTVQFTISIPPVDTTPPIVVINSPENTTYTNTTVVLDYEINEHASWIGYSLDGDDNVTITGDTVLSGLSAGPHNVVVYANDTASNTGMSEIAFTISIPDITPPIITIISPGNSTYDVTSVNLIFTVNEETSWIGYSLDGLDNITIVDSIVFSDLSNGEHRLIIYAEDLSGNIGTSDLIVFTISTENEIPRQLWVVAVIAAIACAGLGFSIYIAYDLFKSRFK